MRIEKEHFDDSFICSEEVKIEIEKMNKEIATKINEVLKKLSDKSIFLITFESGLEKVCNEIRFINPRIRNGNIMTEEINGMWMVSPKIKGNDIAIISNSNKSSESSQIAKMAKNAGCDKAFYIGLTR